MQKLFFWIILFTVIFGVTYLVSDVISPFFIAFIFAYILQPAIDSFSLKLKFSRPAVSVIVFAIFISIFTLIVLMLIPLIYDQISAFVSKVPEYRKYFQDMVDAAALRLSNVDPDAANQLSEAASSTLNSMFSLLSGVANHLWGYTIATINLFTVIALVPIILYYFMRDWEQIVESINGLMPAHGKSKIREIFTSINDLISGYIRGQLNICLILCVYYTIGLSLIGLDLALLLGIMSGFFIIIPFIGALISMALAAISCYITFGFGSEIAYLALLYLIGHTIEGYILVPKIIGNKIGLHPVWIIFAVFAAGSLFGFIGVFFAIPIAGIIKVLIINILDYYKKTNLYKGDDCPSCGDHNMSLERSNSNLK